MNKILYGLVMCSSMVPTVFGMSKGQEFSGVEQDKRKIILTYLTEKSSLLKPMLNQDPRMLPVLNLFLIELYSKSIDNIEELVKKVEDENTTKEERKSYFWYLETRSLFYKYSDPVRGFLGWSEVVHGECKEVMGGLGFDVEKRMKETIYIQTALSTTGGKKNAIIAQLKEYKKTLSKNK